MATDDRALPTRLAYASVRKPFRQAARHMVPRIAGAPRPASHHPQPGVSPNRRRRLQTQGASSVCDLTPSSTLLFLLALLSSFLFAHTLMHSMMMIAERLMCLYNVRKT